MIVNCITINTDASFCPDTGAGGFAFYIVCDAFRIKESGQFKHPPANSTDAEMMCIANALHRLERKLDLPLTKWLVINTDSQNSIDRITRGETRLGHYIREKIRSIEKRIDLKYWDVRHVKAHTFAMDGRSKVNEWCDRHAKAQMRKQRRRI